MFAARIAIWDKNKIVLTVVMGIWLNELGFLIHSKSISLTFRIFNRLQNSVLHQVSHRSGSVPHLDCLNMLSSSNRSIAPTGHLHKLSVAYPTRKKAANIIFLSRSPPT